MTSLSTISALNEVILSGHRLYSMMDVEPAVAAETRLTTSSHHVVKPLLHLLGRDILEVR